MHRLHHRDRIFNRRLGQDAVSEVKDMAVGRVRLGNDVLYPLPDIFLGPEEYAGIQVSLDDNFLAEPFHRMCHIDSPVYADDISTGLLHDLEQPGQSFAKYMTGAPSFLRALIAFFTWGKITFS